MAAALVMLMIVAGLLSPTSLRNSWVMRSVPFTLTSFCISSVQIQDKRRIKIRTKSYQKSETSTSLTGSADFPDPALLTSTSAVPNFVLMSANRFRTALSSRISTD